MEVDERTAMKVEKLRPEVAREPGVARENHQRPDAALTAPLPGDHAARHEDEADDGVRDDEGEIPRLIGDRLSHHGQRHGTNEEREPEEPHGVTRLRAKQARNR